ncbi:MAG: HDIG domain-containing protein [Treponema sp.]|nr:HDIG domain-containing protein [Treponema sp.]
MKVKNNKNKNGEKKNPVAVFFKSAGQYIKVKYPFLILFLLGYVAVTALVFAKITTSETVASFSIDDFEVGQISDRTIIAEKNIAADDANPVTITAGEKIIKKGFEITEESYAKLQKMIASPLYIDYRAFANKILYLLIVSIMYYLLFSLLPFGRKIKLQEPLLQVIFLLIVFFAACFGSKLPLCATPYALCMIIPASLFAMIITILYGQSSAVLFSFVMAFAVLGSGNWEIVPFLFTLASALTSVAIVRKVERRIDLVFSAIILALCDLVFFVLLIVIFNETFTANAKLFIGILCNGFLSGILTLGLLTPLEYMLNTASVFRLMDLSDTNAALLKKMCITASGTYQHSMMVAQLAEFACREIGANPLIARVGGYYHDIGKMEQSEYFVENQQGESERRNDINPTLYTTIIRSHVKKGVEKARQMHLPQVIIDIIAEHHGNSVIQYFYNEAKEKDPTLSPEDFAYPGTPPSTIESGVVMLADTVEAACHTLKNPSIPRLESFITTLINSKIEHHQLDNCDLTYRDITKIKEAFVQILAGFYHSRIEYPDQQDPDAQNQNKQNGAGVQKEVQKEPARDASKEKPAAKPVSKPVVKQKKVES